MNTAKKTLIAITVSGVLTGSSLAALADTNKGQPFEGVVVEDVIVMEQFPTEVKTGSIKVTDDSKRVMAAQAKITSIDAATIALKALPGTVVGTKLDDENDYLVWEVNVLDADGQKAELKIDAGDGRLLAVEAKKKGKHSSWKFWEDNDNDND